VDVAFRYTLAVAALVGSTSSLAAQMTLGLAGGTVSYDNSPTTSSFSANPDLIITQPLFLFDANANGSQASDGLRVLQEGATFWGVTPDVAGPLHLTGLLEAEGIQPQGYNSSSSLLGFGEVAVAGAGGGFAVGVGGARGAVGRSSVTALRTGARAWRSLGVGTLTATAQPTRLRGVWYTEYGAQVEVEQGPWTLLGGATARTAYTLKTATGADSTIKASAGADAMAIWHAGGRAALELTGGRYLSDPYQDLSPGWYFTAGIRLTLWTPPPLASSSNVTQASISAMSLRSRSSRRGATSPFAKAGISGTSCPKTRPRCQ
jgi:hypothetical protein